MISKIRIFAFVCGAAFSSAPHAQVSQDPMQFARQSMRCSLVYGMGAAAEKRDENRENLFAFQASLVRAARKLGASPEQLQTWQDEFTREITDATGKSDDPSKSMKDGTFMPGQIGLCEKFVKGNWTQLTKLFES
jgi:hypothetical protein